MTISGLNDLADVASLVTAALASAFFLQFHYDRRAKRLRLEAKLKADQAAGYKSRSVLGLSIALGISEVELVEASFRSNKVVRRPEEDDSGAAVKMWLAYK